MLKICRCHCKLTALLSDQSAALKLKSNAIRLFVSTVHRIASIVAWAAASLSAGVMPET